MNSMLALGWCHWRHFVVMGILLSAMVISGALRRALHVQLWGRPRKDSGNTGVVQHNFVRSVGDITFQIVSLTTASSSSLLSHGMLLILFLLIIFIRFCINLVGVSRFSWLKFLCDLIEKKFKVLEKFWTWYLKLKNLCKILRILLKVIG